MLDLFSGPEKRLKGIVLDMNRRLEREEKKNKKYCISFDSLCIIILPLIFGSRTIVLDLI